MYKTVHCLVFAFLNSTNTPFQALHLFVQNQLSHLRYSSFHVKMDMKANEWDRPMWCPVWDKHLQSSWAKSHTFDIVQSSFFPFSSFFLHPANIYSASELNLYNLYEAFLLASRRIELNHLFFVPIVLLYISMVALIML